MHSKILVGKDLGIGESGQGPLIPYDSVQKPPLI